MNRHGFTFEEVKRKLSDLTSELHAFEQMKQGRILELEDLQRDIENVCNYFKKKYDVESSVDEILSSFYKKRKKY